jgi:hypothetical protein
MDPRNYSASISLYIYILNMVSISLIVAATLAPRADKGVSSNEIDHDAGQQQDVEEGLDGTSQ